MSGSYQRWGDAAYQRLQEIGPPHTFKKRRTILALADAAYTGQSLNSALKDSKTGSKTAHYKWLEKDPAYADAYAFIVGNQETPGLAHRQRMTEIEEEEARAVTVVAAARRRLKLLSGRAVDALASALDAEIMIPGEEGEVFYRADHTNRRLAAKDILDRNPETAANSKHKIDMDVDLSGLSDEELDKLDRDL